MADLLNNGKEHRVMSTSSVLISLEEVLSQNAIPALRVLGVEESDVEVILSGSVSSYYLKQMAQEAVLPLIGQRRLHNRVSVVRDR
jgi:hypothetical protein